MFDLFEALYTSGLMQVPSLKNYTITKVRDSEKHIDPYNIGWLKLQNEDLLPDINFLTNEITSI